MLLDIRYKNGRGRVQLQLEKIIPATAADFKRILSFVNLADRPEETAKELHGYIAGRVAELQADREKLHHDTDKKQLTKINAEIKRYLNNASALVEVYTDLPAIEDREAKITMKAATVYAVQYDRAEHKQTVKTYSGWTFSKAGLRFDVYKANKADYVIMLHGTGMECARTDKKNGAPAEITPKLIQILENGVEKIEGFKKNFKELMVKEGLQEPEETASALDGLPVIDTATSETVTENAAEAETELTEPAEPKQARGPVPEKTFIGQRIQGAGWQIYFDGDMGKTRVIFDRVPAADVRQAVKAAGFWWSSYTRSWHKGLTFKAYRAAQKLAEELAAIYSA